MREIEVPIGRVWRRLRFQRFLSWFVWSLGMALAVVAGAVLVSKLIERPILGPAWWPFAAAAATATLIAAIVSLVSGPDRIDAAVAIDHAFHLNERLSTVLTLPSDLRETQAGLALIQDTIRHVADLDVRTAFVPRLPRLAWIPIVPALLGVALLYAPDWSEVRAGSRVSDAKIEKKLVIEQTKALGKKIASQRQDMDKTKFPETEKILAQIEKATEELAKAPPAQKDKALVELNKLTDALKEREKQIGSADQLNRQLQQLRNLSSNGPAEQFAKDLVKGDFQKAASELSRLKEKLTTGKLTEAEKKQLREQLGEMAKQLQKLANLDERKKQLEEARKNGGLTEEQFKSEMAKLDQQAQALQKLQKMASRLEEAQKQLQQGNMKQAAEALGMTEQQVSEMAKNLQELEALDSALADLQDAKNGMTGDGLNQFGEAPEGLGMGNRRSNNGNGLGRGRGQGDRPEAPDQTAEYKTKVRQQIGKGKAFAEGTAPSNTPVKGQSFIDIQGEITTSSGNAAEALSNQKVPRNIEKHIRGYFDQINQGK